MTTPSDAVDNEPGQSDPADMELARERIAVLEQRVDEYRKRELVLYRLEKTVETMQLGVTVTDLQGKIVYVNPADAAMHGYEPAALIGQDARVFAAGELGAPLEPGRLADMKSWRREGINVCKDGTEFPVQLMSDVVRDALGDPIGVVTTCEDITDRKRTEEALRASEERYALAAAGASVGLWDWDLESMTVFYSERWKQMLGHEQSDIGTKPDEWWDRIHPDDRERVEAEIQSVTQLESVFEHYESEHRIKHEDGSYRWFLCRGVVVRDER
ncbi:MAG: PAS domain-containing protein, partial [Gemmatimonadales bacterium]